MSQVIQQIKIAKNDAYKIIWRQQRHITSSFLAFEIAIETHSMNNSLYEIVLYELNTKYIYSAIYTLFEY